MNQESLIKIKLIEPSTSTDFFNKESLKDFREFKNDLTGGKTFEDRLNDFAKNDRILQETPAEAKSKPKEIEDKKEDKADAPKSNEPEQAVIKKKPLQSIVLKKSDAALLSGSSEKQIKEASALNKNPQEAVTNSKIQHILGNAPQALMKKIALAKNNNAVTTNEKLLENSKAFGRIDLPNKIAHKLKKLAEKHAKVQEQTKPDGKVASKEAAIPSAKADRGVEKLITNAQHKAPAAASFEKQPTTPLVNREVKTDASNISSDTKQPASNHASLVKQEHAKAKEANTNIDNQLASQNALVANNTLLADNSKSIAREVKSNKPSVQEFEKALSNNSLNAHENTLTPKSIAKNRSEKPAAPQLRVNEEVQLKGFLTERSQAERSTSNFIKTEFTLEKSLEANLRNLTQKWPSNLENVHPGTDHAQSKDKLHLRNGFVAHMSHTPTETNTPRSSLVDSSSLLADLKHNSQQSHMNMGSDARQNNKEQSREKMQEDYIKNALILNSVGKAKTSQAIQQIFEPKSIANTQQAEIIPAIMQQIDRLRKSDKGWMRVSLAMPEGEEISLHLKLTNNNVSIRFQSNDSNLKNSILNGWSELAKASSERGIQLSTPEFVANDFESSVNPLTNRKVYHQA